MITPETVDVRPALDAARRMLLAERTKTGGWVGELSDSALATATACFALHCADSQAHRGMVLRGLDWLAGHCNGDGGWGDTVLSRSNVSTTALGWAALTAGEAPEHRAAADSAEGWLRAHVGGSDAASIARALADRYGRDRTFSVPILSMLALAGRLGEGAEAWRRVEQLPFELAVLPRAFFRWLGLGMVSYALPALIAIGLGRHTHLPAGGPVRRAMRNFAAPRALRLLESIQPASGGFLEAAPLTAFVVMNLATSAERLEGPGRASARNVLRRGAGFLAAAVRPGGCWPIDTNLATWATTLAVNALACAAGAEMQLDAEVRATVRRWLLDQQHRERHPYTNAAGGGWAWTDLSGGVPDADDTAGALLTLRNLGVDEEARFAAAAGAAWLSDLQNRDGGMPTFCRGWGKLPFDRGGADLTAHALRALTAWEDALPPAPRRRAERAVARGLDFLRDAQRPDGAWTPLWFGNEHEASEANPTYGTSRVVLALAELFEQRPMAASLAAGVDWLLRAQAADGGWGGGAGTPASIEETAVAVEALASVLESPDGVGGPREGDVAGAVIRGARWLVERTAGGTRFDPAPIGLYFARLWYFERVYPMVFTVAALSRVCRLVGGGWLSATGPGKGRMTKYGRGRCGTCVLGLD